MKFRLIKFLLPLSLVLFFVAGCGNSKAEIPSEITDGYMLGDYETYANEKVEKGNFLEEIRNCIDGAIGDGEVYKQIDFNNKNLYVSVDLSNANELYDGYKKDLAISRVESITDEILKQKDYFMIGIQ